MWSCDGSSSHVALESLPNHVGVLELPGGLFEGGASYTITMVAIWASGASTETWIAFRAAQGPHGGTCDMSAPNGTAMVDRFAISCPLWTASDPVCSLSLAPCAEPLKCQFQQSCLASLLTLVFHAGTAPFDI